MMPHGELWGYVAGAVIGAIVLVTTVMRTGKRTLTKVRTYEKTHPWFTFAVDLRHAEVPFWTLLGEAHSKCEHIAQVLLTPETGAQLHQIYLAKGAAATTAIEGNTLSEAQVKSLLEGKLECSIYRPGRRRGAGQT